MNHKEYKEHLLAQIISSADVQAQKAKKNPGDDRYSHSEKTLHALADNLGRVPASDPFFMRACNLRFGGDHMSDMTDEELMKMGNVETDLISKYGFVGKANGKPEQFLRSLVDTLTKTAIMLR